ncbi:MAG TPA: MBL fold metallo-hydrolase, partial [Elusimicrobiales bacterium]|nr:MBL fold metallo-hydrolase [Elusimicrobiales bacterium]
MGKNNLLANIHWLGHSAFRIETAEGIIIYIDPFHLKKNLPKADLILCTHEHHDHCSPEDIEKITSLRTELAGPPGVESKLAPKKVLPAKPFRIFTAGGIIVEPIPAYNIDKPYHTREMGHVGYLLTVGGIRIYHAGDTDFIPEMRTLKADVALLPIGGTYTMDAAEAAKAAAVIKPT